MVRGFWISLKARLTGFSILKASRIGREVSIIGACPFAGVLLADAPVQDKLLALVSILGYEVDFEAVSDQCLLNVDIFFLPFRRALFLLIFKVVLVIRRVELLPLLSLSLA